jgi:tetratricopeptide (TPR) repeat protein/uncharacterized RDD family membrane protein YckC
MNASTVSSTIATTPSATICGFWRRCHAIAIDASILGVGGFIAGHFLFDAFASLGRWGRFLGLAIELSYFGFLNSSIGGGQTAGKRIMSIRVIDRSGAYLSPGRSLARAAILCTPFTLNGESLPVFNSGVVVNTLLSVVVFGGMGAIVYLYIFNRATRQSLHDLLVGSYVASSPVQGSLVPRPVWPGHFAVLAVALAGIVGMVTIVVPRILNNVPIESIMSAQRTLEAQPTIKIASVSMGTSWSGGHTTRYATVQAVVFPKPAAFERTAQSIARQLLMELPAVAQIDTLTVQVTYGYDIGISRYSERETFNWSPKDLLPRPKDALLPAIERTGPLKPLTPPLTVNKLDILAELRARRFEALDERLKSYQQRAERNVAEEANMRLAFQTFENSDPNLAGLLSEWVKSSPSSYAAHLAWATYLFKQGWRARGGKVAAETGAGRLADMESLFAHGAREVREALFLNSKLAQAYVLQLQRERASGETDACMKLGESVLKLVPTSFIVRLEMMKCLEPRWGGSAEAMEAFARESQRFVGQNPRLAVLKGFPDFDKAVWVHGRQKDYASELRSYTKAIEKGGDEAMFYQARGELFSVLGQTQQAIEDFERANRLWPQSQETLESLAREQAQIGKYTEALDTLELASRVGGPSSYAQELRTFLLPKLGRGPKGQGVGGD